MPSLLTVSLISAMKYHNKIPVNARLIEPVYVDLFKTTPLEKYEKHT